MLKSFKSRCEDALRDLVHSDMDYVIFRGGRRQKQTYILYICTEYISVYIKTTGISRVHARIYTKIYNKYRKVAIYYCLPQAMSGAAWSVPYGLPRRVYKVGKMVGLEYSSTAG
jgi:hypothetical protein